MREAGSYIYTLPMATLYGGSGLSFDRSDTYIYSNLTYYNMFRLLIFVVTCNKTPEYQCIIIYTNIIWLVVWMSHMRWFTLTREILLQPMYTDRRS